MLMAILAAALSLTFPDSLPRLATCDVDSAPESGPLKVVIERLSQNSYDWQRVDSLSGMPGQSVSRPVNLSGCSPCGFRVWTYDAAGNRSLCHSNIVNLWEHGEPVGIPPPIPVKRELFDIAGRRINGVPRQGIYFERVTDALGVRRKKVVFVR